MVDRLLSKTTDNSLLISRFQEFLEMEDVRYYVMSSIRENLGQVMDKNKGVGELCGTLNLSAVAISIQCVTITWFAEHCWLVLFLSGSFAHISEQRVHPHVQHQRAKPGIGAHQLYGQTGRWARPFDIVTVPKSVITAVMLNCVCVWR